MKKTKKYEIQGLKDSDDLDNYNSWFWDEVKLHAKNNILEIGSGLGRVSQYIVKDFDNVTLSDFSDEYIPILKKKFPNNKVIQIDLTKCNIKNKYDCIICCNVIEHIENERLAILNLYRMLRPGGILIIQVPACPFLYNEIDKSIYHYRRYTKKSLHTLLSERFTIKKMDYFNLFGIPGWYVTGTILRRKTINEGSLHLFNRLLPMLKFIDKKVFRNIIGVNVVAVCKKTK